MGTKSSRGVLSAQGVIIADTSGLISLFYPTDHNHHAAIQAAKRLQSKHQDILIPSAVFIEFLNILGRKAGHQAAITAAEELRPPFLILGEPNDHTEALRKFATAPQAVSFTDCIVMAFADEYDTKDIFGFDKQFQDAGYNRLEPSTDWS